jgi:hypothetical protein
MGREEGGENRWVGRKEGRMYGKGLGREVRMDGEGGWLRRGGGGEGREGKCVLLN